MLTTWGADEARQISSCMRRGSMRTEVPSRVRLSSRGSAIHSPICHDALSKG